MARYMIVVVVGSLLLLRQRAYLRGSLLMLVALARRWLHHLSPVRLFRLRRNPIELPVHLSSTLSRCR